MSGPSFIATLLGLQRYHWYRRHVGGAWNYSWVDICLGRDRNQHSAMWLPGPPGPCERVIRSEFHLPMARALKP